MAAGLPGAMAAQAPDTVSLADAIAEALDRNPSVRQARAAVRSADGQVREAWASALPDINASATYQRNFLVQEQIFEFDGEVIRASSASRTTAAGLPRTAAVSGDVIIGSAPREYRASSVSVRGRRRVS
jgi:outer membrane protein TolC